MQNSFDQKDRPLSPETGSVPPVSVNLSRSFRRRVLAVFLSLLIYLVVFIVLLNLYGAGGPTAAILPVAVTGWLFGLVPGVCAAILAFPVNFLISALLGADLPGLVGGGGIAGTLAIACIGAIVGRLHDVTLRLGGELTERRRAETALVASKEEAVAAKEEAVEANKFRSRFFTNITHEFRTPLTLAIGPVEGILRSEFGEVAPEMRNQLEIVLKSTRQLLRLVNQLLDFSMLESGAGSVVRETKDIRLFVSAVLDSFSLAAEKKKIRLGFNSDDNISLFAVDSGKLEKVFYNILGNAFKYTPQGGVISVVITETETIGVDPDETLISYVEDSAVPENHYLKISIRDTGVGIKKENHLKVFDRFRQAGR